MTQLTLDDVERIPAVRNTDPDTSRTPAPSQLSAGRWKVLDALYRHGPLTDFQHEQFSGLAQTSAGKRRLDLQRLGWVERVGTSVSPHGAAAAVWALTDAGRTAYQAMRTERGAATNGSSHPAAPATTGSCGSPTPAPKEDQ